MTTRQGMQVGRQAHGRTDRQIEIEMQIQMWMYRCKCKYQAISSLVQYLEMIMYDDLFMHMYLYFVICMYIRTYIQIHSSHSHYRFNDSYINIGLVLQAAWLADPLRLNMCKSSTKKHTSKTYTLVIKHHRGTKHDFRHV